MIKDSRKIRINYTENNQLEVHWNYSEFFYPPYKLYDIAKEENLKKGDTKGLRKYLIFNLSLIALFWVALSIYYSDYSFDFWRLGIIFLGCYAGFLLLMAKVVLSGIKREVKRQIENAK